MQARKKSSLFLAPVVGLALAGCWFDSPEDSIGDIQRHLQEGKYRSAEITAKSLLKDAQQNSDSGLQRVSRLLLARTYFATGDSKNAARFYDSLTFTADRSATTAYNDIVATEADWHRWLLSAWETNDSKLASTILKQPGGSFSETALQVYRVRQLLAEQRADDAQSVLELTRPPGADTSPYVRYQFALMQSSNSREAALAMVEQLIDEDSQFAQARLLRARLLQAGGDHTAALRAYQDYISLRPADVGAKIVAALTAFQVGDYDSARATIHNLEKLAPDQPTVLQLRGMLAMHDKDFAEAKSFAEQSLSIGADTFINHLLIGVGAYQQQSWEQANRHLAMINAQLPRDHFARKMLVETKLQLNESREAADIFRDIDTREVIDVALANRVSARLIQDGGFSAAGDVQQQVADIDIDEQELVLQRQALNQALKRNEFKQALIESINNKDADARDKLRLILLYIADNEMGRAKQLASDWLKASPEDVNALNAAAMVAQREGNEYRVEEYLARALAREPNNIPSLVMRLNLQRQNNRWAEVAASAERLLLELNFTKPAIFNLWLEASHRLGNATLNKALPLIAADDSKQLEGVWLSFLLQSKQPELVEEYLEKQVEPADWTVRHTVSNILSAAQLNKADLAVSRIKKLIASEEFGSAQSAQFTLAMAARLQRFDLVLSAIERADGLNLVIKNRDLVAASAYIHLGELDRALRSLQQHPIEDGAYFEVSADLASAREDYRKAWELLEKSVQVEITPARLRRLFVVGNKINKRSAVKDHIRNYFKARPADNLSRRLVSQWYLEDSPRFAIELLDSGAMQQELESDWVTTNNLAWLYHQIGDTEKARRYAEHAISHAPQRAEVIDTYATVFGHKPGG